MRRVFGQNKLAHNLETSGGILATGQSRGTRPSDLTSIWPTKQNLSLWQNPFGAYIKSASTSIPSITRAGRIQPKRVLASL